MRWPSPEALIDWAAALQMWRVAIAPDPEPPPAPAGRAAARPRGSRGRAARAREPAGPGLIATRAAVEAMLGWLGPEELGPPGLPGEAAPALAGLPQLCDAAGAAEDAAQAAADFLPRATLAHAAATAELAAACGAVAAALQEALRAPDLGDLDRLQLRADMEALERCDAPRRRRRR